MTRERAKELLPIIQAYAEGKVIQVQCSDYVWMSIDDPIWSSGDKYRIAPDEECVPFTYDDKDHIIGECIKHKVDKSILLITGVVTEGVFANGSIISYSDLLENWIFKSGRSCGKKIYY